MSASTSPRILLEFQNCKREDFLDWYIQATKAAINASLECPEEALALKVVDEESGRIAGYAVWGWSSRVSYLPFQRLQNSERLLLKITGIREDVKQTNSNDIGYRFSLQEESGTSSPRWDKQGPSKQVRQRPCRSGEDLSTPWRLFWLVSLNDYIKLSRQV